MSHLEQRLESDLNNIRSQVAEQAVLAEASVKNAITSLQTGNKKLAYNTVLNDQAINRNTREIDRLCHRFIALHLPTAGHLRLLSSVIRVNIELERVGDYAVTIAREGIQLSSPLEGGLADELERASYETQLLLNQAIHAFNELNADMAKGTITLAAKMGNNLTKLYNRLLNNEQNLAVKDLFATFIVFSQLKRVADQAKNLCEETVFAVTGDQKEPKYYKVLFVDEENGLLSQLAEAIARINYPESDHFRSAGRVPKEQLDPRLSHFLEQHSTSLEEATYTAISDITPAELTEQHVIITLQGRCDHYFDKIPFHTSVLEWDITPESEIDSEQKMDMLYRELAIHIKDLMQQLRGEEQA
jgi:phosphate transport system protein